MAKRELSTTLKSLKVPSPSSPSAFFFVWFFYCSILVLALLISPVGVVMPYAVSAWVVVGRFLLLLSRHSWKFVVFSYCELVWLFVLMRLSLQRFNFDVLNGGIRDSRRAGGWNCTVLLEYYLFLLLLFWFFDWEAFSLFSVIELIEHCFFVMMWVVTCPCKIFPSKTVHAKSYTERG